MKSKLYCTQFMRAYKRNDIYHMWDSLYEVEAVLYSVHESL